MRVKILWRAEQDVAEQFREHVPDEGIGLLPVRRGKYRPPMEDQDVAGVPARHAPERNRVNPAGYEGHVLDDNVDAVGFRGVDRQMSDGCQDGLVEALTARERPWERGRDEGAAEPPAAPITRLTLDGLGP